LAATIGPNRFQQKRTVSWLISIPRQEILDDTHDSGYHPYIITARRMTSGDLLKYRTGFSWHEATTTKAASIMV
jgi:hypothetical protein